MQIPFVNLKKQHAPFSLQLQKIINELLSTNVVMGGKAIDRFESEFASYLEVDHSLSCANATDALEIVLRAWNIKDGDEVIIPANGWMSAAEATRLIGATPVFIDNKADSYCLDEQLLEEKINSRTKVIIPIHLYGEPANMPIICEIAQRHSIEVLEDCAQAHGASLHRKKLGSWGQAGIYSFYPTKNLGALGDGGMIVTSDNQLVTKCRAIANHGQTQADKHEFLGRNSRMDALQAKILSLKLPYLNQWNERRKTIASYYLESWAKLPVVLPEAHPDSVWHLFVVQVNQRERVQQELARLGIATKVHYPVPVCCQPIFEEFAKNQSFPNAEEQATRLLSIPVYPELSDTQVEFIAQKFKEVIEVGLS